MTDITLEVDYGVVVPLTYATAQVSPPTGLAAAAVAGGGTFAAGTYFWEVTATTALGETTVSNEASAVIALNGSASLTWALPPGPVTHIKVYRGTISGGENALIATLGVVTAFTDTGTAGSAASPPVANTASIQDTVLLTGYGEVVGYTFAETSGTNVAYVEFQDSSTIIFILRLAAGGSDTREIGEMKQPLNGRVNAHVYSGSVRGVVLVRIPPC